MKYQEWIQQINGGLIHVGAHYAEEAPLYDELGLHVMWIEACPAFSKRLAEALVQFQRQDFRISALSGKANELRTFHISNNGEGVSSSFKKFGKGAEDLWPELSLCHSDGRTVVTSTLDHLMASECSWMAENDPKTLVLDVQGSECEVLKGAEGSLWRFDTIIVEVSSTDVYEGAITDSKVDEVLRRHGFWRRDYDPHRPGHGDALYVRDQPDRGIDTTTKWEGSLAFNEAAWGHFERLNLITNGMSVLVVGCAPEWLTRKLLNMGCLVVCVDRCTETIRHVNRSLAFDEKMRWVGYTYNLCREICPEGLKFDCVLANEIIDEWSTVESFLKTASETTKVLYIPGALVTKLKNSKIHVCETTNQSGIISAGDETKEENDTSQPSIFNTMTNYFQWVYTIDDVSNDRIFGLTSDRERVAELQKQRRISLVASKSNLGKFSVVLD